MKQALLSQIAIKRGDITKSDADMIVNAANSALCGGGGVDGAIHDAAGEELLQACLELGRCDVGDVKVTSGFALKAKWIAHAVGPVWQGGEKDEAKLLASCYARSLAHADDRGCSTIAFPAISTGAYRFPSLAAARIAVRTVAEELTSRKSRLQVTFVCFDHHTVAAHERAKAELLERAET